jgi:hypothetical protein
MLHTLRKTPSGRVPTRAFKRYQGPMPRWLECVETSPFSTIVAYTVAATGVRFAPLIRIGGTRGGAWRAWIASSTVAATRRS